MNEEERKQLIGEMKEVFATKEDLKAFAKKEDLEVFATKEDLAVFATIKDHVSLEEKVDGLTENTNQLLKEMNGMTARLHQMPTKDELVTAVYETYDLATLKKEHDHMKNIVQDKLGVEV